MISDAYMSDIMACMDRQPGISNLKALGPDRRPSAFVNNPLHSRLVQAWVVFEGRDTMISREGFLERQE